MRAAPAPVISIESWADAGATDRKKITPGSRRIVVLTDSILFVLWAESKFQLPGKQLARRGERQRRGGLDRALDLGIVSGIAARLAHLYRDHVAAGNLHNLEFRRRVPGDTRQFAFTDSVPDCGLDARDVLVQRLGSGRRRRAGCIRLLAGEQVLQLTLLFLLVERLLVHGQLLAHTLLELGVGFRLHLGLF